MRRLRTPARVTDAIAGGRRGLPAERPAMRRVQTTVLLAAPLAAATAGRRRG